MRAESGELERLLASRVGLDPLSVGSALIRPAARQRMKELGIDNIHAYEQRACRSSLELQSLIEEVVVSESWFFVMHGRISGSVAMLSDDGWAIWLARHSALDLACAGGEEPYSIAIMLRDVGLPACRFQIDAVDISARQMAIARRGVYSPNAFRGSDLSFRQQYFREHPQGYELDCSIRSTVLFVQANVLDPNLLEGSAPYDVVFCRNLLIYLQPSDVAVVSGDRTATDGGWVLFVGHADRLDVPGVESRFVAVDDPGYFVYRRRSQDGVSVPWPLRQLNPPPRSWP